MILSTTGHRPTRIAAVMGAAHFGPEIADALRLFARRQVIISNPDRMAIGMAVGWDTAVARACIDLTIPFVAYIPFLGQESRWPGRDQEMYRYLLTRAEAVIVCAKHHLMVAYFERNEMMIDSSDELLAFYSGSRGGTAHAVGYANGWLKPVRNCWQDWIEGHGAA